MDPAPPLRYETVTMHSEVSLQLAADLTDSTVETLKQLNPALLRSATPPSDYELRVPEGTAEQFRAEITRVPAEKRASWRRPEVQDSDTLASIAKQYRVKEADIVELNDLEGAGLTAGLRLTIPTETKLEVYGGGGQAGGLIEGGSGRYRIASGDTLAGIASRLGVSVPQLMAWNGLSSTRIRAGRYLLVKSSGGDGGGSYVASKSSAPAPNGRYTVRRGDNLTGIATRHGVSVSELQAWNKLRGGQVDIGQVLRVPGRSGLQQRQAAALAGPSTYRIRSGDNLASIALRHGISVEELKDWNSLRGTDIRAGDTLRVAAAPAQASQPSASRPGTGSSSAAPSRRAASGSPDSEARRYRVRRGDNLAAIAQQFGVSIEELKAWNGLKSNRITAGEYLTIRASNAAGAIRASNSAGSMPASDSASAGQYRIQRGDTLDGIAKRFGVTIDQLKSWNSLRGTRIQVGDSLTINPEDSSNRKQPRLASLGGG